MSTTATIETQTSIAILANSTHLTTSQIKEQLDKELSQQSFLHDYKLIMAPSNESNWDDSLITQVEEHHALWIVNIQSQDESVDITFGHQLGEKEVSKLKKTKNSGAILQAYCLIATDLTEPEQATLPCTEEIAELHITPAAREEINMLDLNHCIHSSGTLSLYFFKGHEAPETLELIGRSRAITFASIGAGAGLEVDLSPEDQYYDHIMLWDKTADTLVGAYRVGFSQEIIASHGKKGLYLDHVFQFDKEYYEKMGNAVELSRSFILPTYQKNPQMLDALWRGVITAAMNKGYSTFYGSVTISASFTPLSQAILVSTMDKYHSAPPEIRECISSDMPFTPSTKHHESVADAWADAGINRLNRIIETIERDQRPMPPLIRYYIALNAKFLAFHVEKSFNNAIYCLLRVDLDNFPKRFKKRFLED